MKQQLQELFNKHQISDIAYDSRQVSPGSAYFAIKGAEADGNDFIEDAKKNGAILIFTEDRSSTDNDIIVIEDVRLALAIAAGLIYPKLPEKLIAVTGTNGKSSVVSYCQQMLVKLGINAIAFGTIGLEGEAKIINNLSALGGEGLTSFDPITFRKILHRAAENDVQVVAFEASSHGLQQRRMGDVPVDAAAFISFSQDHLDYHKTMGKYLSAKLELFHRNLIKGKKAIIASDIHLKEKIIDELSKSQIAVCECGKNGEVEVVACKSTIATQHVEYLREGKQYKFDTDIIGSYQATNLLIAGELVAELELPNVTYVDIAANLAEVRAVRGRMERVSEGASPYHVFVDYSHTPDALEKSLLELKALLKNGGILRVVFGAGGERDKAKRPKMGDIAAKLADYVVITDDNPRSENAAEIRREIIDKHAGFIEIEDRAIAIKSAVEKLQKNDIMLIAGKGHEGFQIIGDKKIQFCDLAVAKKCLDEKK